MNKNLAPHATDLAGTVSVNKICNRYIIDVLENNWNEERFDIEYQKTDKPLQSDYQHYYDTTYSDYEKKYGIKNLDPKLILAKSKNSQLFVQECLRNEFFKTPVYDAQEHRLNAFPGHQPELDTDYAKVKSNTYQTEYRVHYMDPDLKKVPINLRQELLKEVQKIEKK